MQILSIILAIMSNILITIYKISTTQALIMVLQQVIVTAIRALNKISYGQDGVKSEIDELMLRNSTSSLVKNMNMNHRDKLEISKIMRRIVRNHKINTIMEDSAQSNIMKDELINYVSMMSIIMKVINNKRIYYAYYMIKSVTILMIMVGYYEQIIVKEQIDQHYLDVDINWNIVNKNEKIVIKYIRGLIWFIAASEIVNLIIIIGRIIKNNNKMTILIRRIIDLLEIVGISWLDRIMVLQSVKQGTQMIVESGRREVELTFNEEIFDAQDIYSDSNSENGLSEEGL